jgi:hypothetical protein
MRVGLAGSDELRVVVRVVAYEIILQARVLAWVCFYFTPCVSGTLFLYKLCAICDS